MHIQMCEHAAAFTVDAVCEEKALDFMIITEILQRTLMAFVYLWNMLS